MMRLIDFAQKARRNASMSFRCCLAIIDVKEPFKSIKRPYPRLKVNLAGELYKDSLLSGIKAKNNFRIGREDVRESLFKKDIHEIYGMDWSNDDVMWFTILEKRDYEEI